MKVVYTIFVFNIMKVIILGSLASLRHLKNEIDIIKKDVECGLQLLDKTIAFQQGDTIVCFEKKTKLQVTDWRPEGF